MSPSRRADADARRALLRVMRAARGAVCAQAARVLFMLPWPLMLMPLPCLFIAIAYV